MAKGIAFSVFLLPVILSLIFGGAVMAEVLKKPDRDLQMWNFDFSQSKFGEHESIKILGLQSMYSSTNPVEIQVEVMDPVYDCGDLYITIYDLSSNPKEVFSQNGFFDQCYAIGSDFLPIDEEFSEIIDNSGSYEIVISINDKSQKEKDSVSARFTVT